MHPNQVAAVVFIDDSGDLKQSECNTVWSHGEGTYDVGEDGEPGDKFLPGAIELQRAAVMSISPYSRYQSI